MKKCTDRDLFKKYARFEINQGRNVKAFSYFHKQFDEYQRTKTGQKVQPTSVCRPYVEVFHQLERRRKS